MPPAKTPPPPPTEGQLAAAEAGLRYVDPASPGIVRESFRGGFRYRESGGGLVRDQETLARIRHLAIPPAWEKVWICPRANGHIQAIGYDARGRKQYRYHADWRATRDAAKFGRMIAFGTALPRIRRRVARDLKLRGLPKEKVLAAIVQLLECTHIRIGNEEYARENHSFGLSTLRDRHVDIRGGRMRFHFVGKSGKAHDIELRSPRLARVVRAAQDLPGQELFQYLDAAGERQKIRSDDVNAYLRAIAGEEFSAKDFRTWAGTVLAALSLRQFALQDGQPTKKNLAAAVQQVAADLRNTPAICRKCYIHPAVMDGYLAGETIAILRPRLDQVSARAGWRLGAEEAALLEFLRHKLRTSRIPLATLLKQSVQRTAKRAA